MLAGSAHPMRMHFLGDRVTKIDVIMFQKVSESNFLHGEHEVLKFWADRRIFQKLCEQNVGKPKWNFLDGPITANNPMGVHHAWGRTYKDAYQRYFAMTGHELRYQNGFDCQGLWVEVEVERELNFTTKKSILEFGIDRFVNECKKRVLIYAARQTEQSIRLGFWMDWDDSDQLRNLAASIGSDKEVAITTPRGEKLSGKADQLVARLGSPNWGGSYFTFSTENNESIWAFLKKCHQRGKIYRGHDVMPWSGLSGSAYSQTEVADGRRLSVHTSVFVRFPIKGRDNEYLFVWTTTPWTLAGNIACAVNLDLDYAKVRTKRDGAVYYCASDNLEFQRLEREYKDGFGRPEWNWPDEVPKLKTIAQIFKEQGGFQIEGTLKGRDMIGWEYEGPFDELPVQNQPGGHPIDEDLKHLTGAISHRVIDGGRDSKGSPHVVAGEGTGIVHIAPGSGDVDFQLGRQHGLITIAPLEDDGRFTNGFGELSGLEAIAPKVAEMICDSLRSKRLLVASEDYPHIYPHCWRTGEPLVFRLVDEWFINMDWRDEIKQVTRKIRWLPEAIDGEQRELEWLTNMRDWMISKKRFWGLALPIWVDEETGDFEVIGSLAELKERSVEGWDEFDGHTPHRPWIDGVKICNPRTGNLMARIVDVGNPWLDAGIVPFSTLQYNTNREAWKGQYPADFVTECFPGQFRNWFYALLSMAAMMRYDETDDPAEKRPFKTLLGHRLVMDENGKAMHKTDGTAIWFEEAAEQLGVDTIRWMYLAQNPFVDLRFGKRLKDKQITLQTPNGSIDQTSEGLPTCKVVSRPADQIRRQILIPLWNSYAFFINYARLDQFDPRPVLQLGRNASHDKSHQVQCDGCIPVSERQEIDRWILSNLQDLIETANREFREYNAAEVCRVAAEFIDDLSNWYIRRNRRRFWRSHNAADHDKLAAYQTLYEVLVTLTKLLAPAIPFITERMYQNLVHSWAKNGRSETLIDPESVHLCSYPQADRTLLDPELNCCMATAQTVVKLGHKLRAQTNLRVRQPLTELRYTVADPKQLAAIERLAEVIKEELNVKQLIARDNLDDLLCYIYKPNLKTLGPKYGNLLGQLRQTLLQLDHQAFVPLHGGKTISIDIEGTEVVLLPEDVLISTEQAADWVCADDQGVQVALMTSLTPELECEGMRNDFVRHVQQLRKEQNLEIEDRICIFHGADDSEVTAITEEWAEYIRAETLADSIERSDTVVPKEKMVVVGGAEVTIWIKKSR